MGKCLVQKAGNQLYLKSSPRSQYELTKFEPTVKVRSNSKVLEERRLGSEMARATATGWTLALYNNEVESRTRETIDKPR